MMDINTLLTLDLAEYTTALEALADQMMLEEPRDIDLMRRREFAVWNFTVGYCMNAADALSLLRAQANENANDGTADLATINNSAARLCDWFSGAFDVTGKMDDTTAILAHSRDLYAQVETHEQFAALTRATERYLVQLQFWVDRQIPWPAISDLVHGYRLRTESGETRETDQTDQQSPIAEPKVRIRGLETHPAASPPRSKAVRVSRQRREKARG